MEGDEIIGHAALRATGHPGTYKVSCLYLKSRWRNQGKGQELAELLEAFAGKRLCAGRLELVVRDYNPRALSCYQKCGFQITGQENTLIRMHKIL